MLLVSGQNPRHESFGVAYMASERLELRRVERFKVSTDANFADKLEAIVGLYLKSCEVPSHQTAVEKIASVHQTASL